VVDMSYYSDILAVSYSSRGECSAFLTLVLASEASNELDIFLMGLL
jgi:hypothetical protein